MRGTVRYMLSLVPVVFWRAAAAPGVLMVRFIGILLAVVLMTGVTLYSSAMGDAMLQASLRRDQGSSNIVTSVGGTALTAAAYARLDSYVRAREAGDLGLPLTRLSIHDGTSTMAVYRAGALGHGAAPAPLAYLTLNYYGSLADQVRVVSGALDAPPALRAAVPVVVTRSTAQGLHLQVADRLAYSVDGHSQQGPTLVVAAIVVPRDVNSPFWGVQAGVQDDHSLIVTQAGSFVSLSALSNQFFPEFIWAYTTDLSAVHLADAQALLGRIRRVDSLVGTFAPGAALITTIDLGLNGFASQYSLLPVILFILVTPIVALVLYAIEVVTALVLDRQAGEVVLWRSRGASVAQVSAVYVLEGVVLGIGALVIGPPLGLVLGQIIAHASGFLRFGGGLPYDLHLTRQTYLLAGATALLGLLAGLVPALNLTRRSVNAFKQEQARPGRRPLWQRLFLDVAVLALALYGLSVLVRQGRISSGTDTAAIAQDPLIALSPLLFAVALALLVSRGLPWMAALGDRMLGSVVSPAAHVALLSVARTPHQAMRLVQLSTLTLTLGVFAATVAGVEASNLSDQQLYAAGAQVRLMEYNVLLKQWDAMPLADHRALPGVAGATPALRLESSSNAQNITSDGTNVNLLGIDPSSANGVIYYRPDFAGRPLEQLLAVIARPGPDVIVSDTFLGATGLHMGDGVEVTLSNGRTLHARIAATARYFATLDPMPPFVITNLAYLEQASHRPGPSEVWLATAPNQGTVDRLLAATSTWPRRIVDVQGAAPAFSAQDEPLAAGVYGVVSVGFLAVLGLALLGYVTYAYLSLQRRRIDFAIVRALGLSAGQLFWLLLCEQLYVLGAGISGGIVAGVLTTMLFLPYLPFASNTVPPFLIVTPWTAILEFIAAVFVVFLLAMSVHVSMLLRLQLGRVLRLGDT